MRTRPVASEYTHQPVLLNAVLQGFQSLPAGLLVDGTLGLGGHSEALLQAQPQSVLLGIDRDEMAIARAQQRLARFGERFQAIQADFREISVVIAQSRFSDRPLQGVLTDLGVSSLQFDMAERGFSFQHEGPLDMRMDRRQPTTAATLVNTLPEVELANLIYQYGEEPASRVIARRIVGARTQKPIETTGELARIVAQAVGWRGAKGHRQRIHPATRTFQALRIAVNRELEQLSEFVSQVVDRLAPTGRLAVITFHSLEDRLIKNAFRYEAGQCRCARDLPICACGAQTRVKILTKKPIIADEQEVSANPRARSAKLRICEKVSATAAVVSENSIEAGEEE